MDLAAHRYLNLIYHAQITHFGQIAIWVDDVNEYEKMIATVDRSLENVTTSDGAPAWWHGDEDASASSMAAARALGAG